MRASKCRWFELFIMNPTPPATEPGFHTLTEIFSQPACWHECLSKIAVSPDLAAAAAMARPQAEWLFVGCGTSFYLAISAAAAFNALGIVARAVPASEVLLYPSLALVAGRDTVPVVISRSGRTSEAVRAARQLEKQHNLRCVAITCADGQPLEAECSITLKLIDADESSMVMTRSFTSMLLALQYLGAKISRNGEAQAALTSLSQQAAPLFETIPQRLQEFVDGNDFNDCVFLAQGPLFGVASECMLKTTEASCTYTQVFHSLEFRHGPKSIVSPSALLVFLLAESSYEAEVELLQEMKELGASILAIGNRLDARAITSSDFTIDLGLGIPEFARPAAYTVWGQLLGVYRGLKKGMNPDAPRNLSRVVVLDED